MKEYKYVKILPPVDYKDSKDYYEIEVRDDNDQFVKFETANGSKDKEGGGVIMRKEELMYICLCGENSFRILTGYIECTVCGNRYNYYHGFLHDPKIFNGRRASYLEKGAGQRSPKSPVRA